MDGTFPDHQSVLRDILASHGIPADSVFIEKVHQERVGAKAVPFYDIIPEVLKVLQIVKGKGLKVGLISNCAPEEVLSWNNCELATYFDAVIFSCDVKQAKPNRKIYEIACEKLEVTPQEAIFIGDGGANELVGAIEAGIQAFHATWFLPKYKSEQIKDFYKLETPMDVLKVL
ncbi:HAD-IA family hydrolase [Fictibacillus nanhaiensis]|uniref:HAD family hydrolase n=1 Tax=Fictibacillus nanhaiensis TaxID=742169 RepID=UPI001C96BCB8|nr:HAD-IA family hydrolase [Fictibacillus nanhaiensis]MBY6037619.1 HAD-IA family hydrolase [Fictibacillus nanhaiensis]